MTQETLIGFGNEEGAEFLLAEAGSIILTLDFTPPNTVVPSVATPLPLPVGAVIDTALFEVVVDPPGRARIADVAETRAVDPTAGGESTSHVVDFKILQTVSEVEMGAFAPGLILLNPWMGTEFGDPLMYTSVPIDGFRTMAFPDIRTERLLLTLREAALPSELADTEVVLPSPPSSVEILVNGVRAWFRAVDASAPQSHPDITGTHSLAEVVDLRAALQTALDESNGVTVELRASSAAQLQFRAVPLQFFRTHRVVFGDGPSRSFTATDEGFYDIDFPLPNEPGVENWDVHAVEFSLRADLTDTRVQPAIGPTLLDDLELSLADDRTLFVKLPGSLLQQFGEITGVRLPMRAGAGGAELAGELRADDTTVLPSRPGITLPDHTFSPVTVEDGAISYHTLSLETTYQPSSEPDQSATAWAALRASRGEAIWSIAEAENEDDDAAQLRWQAPSGVARRLSSITVSTADTETVLAGAVRVVGKSDPNRPLDAVSVEVLGRPEVASLTPFESGSDVRIDLESSISPAEQEAGTDSSLRLRFVAAAPGGYTIEQAVVIYTDPALDTPFEPAASGGAS